MSKNHRLVGLGLLTVILGMLFVFPPTKPNVSIEISAILFSSLFIASFTALLLEHFFVRPTDVLAAAVSILLLLIPSHGLLDEWGSWWWGFLGYESFLVLLSSASLLLLTNDEGAGSPRNRWSKMLKRVAIKIGPGKTQFFFLSLLILVFYVNTEPTSFLAFLMYGGFVVLMDPSRLRILPFRALKPDTCEVGELIGVEGTDVFLARLYPERSRPSVHMDHLLEFSYGMDEPPRTRRGIILERFFLDRAQWIRVLSHREIDTISATMPALPKHRSNAVYAREGQDGRPFLTSLVGVVEKGSDVTNLRFLKVGHGRVNEGDLVRIDILGQPVLYQVFNAQIDTESLESRNKADLVVGQAIQMGVLDSRNGTFERFGWVPSPRSPVMLTDELPIPEPKANDITIGRIPGTIFPVILNAAEVVSHHLAILGVTGVGKSVFARELIRRLIVDDLRIIVVDFTREWRGRLEDVDATILITEDQAEPLRRMIDEMTEELSKFKNQQNKSFIEERKRNLTKGFGKIIDAFLRDAESAVGIFELPDISNTEGVLEYTQWFFRTLFQTAKERQNYGKRVCVVLEEAHTVVPEWNFIGLADRSSQALVNNISQIALQGRKYSVGFVVVAQRTASVSKTVLTQCNTIVAFQCFDGTSIDFLSHYLPRPLAEMLPRLRARRAIAVGKAVRGSVPLIFDVPKIEEGGRVADGLVSG